jgi:hypothetical protein
LGWWRPQEGTLIVPRIGEGSSGVGRSVKRGCCESGENEIGRWGSF